jgi:16S rRNA (guanine966-N2)-methyltransferase
VRVIAGQFRSRPLRSLKGLDIRPTSDRLRETLFDILTAGNPAALQGSVWLDLFAGTGAVGIEAISRGAAMVYFVECSRRAVELIRANLASLGISSGFEILQQHATSAVAEIEKRRVAADYLFLDPPYSSQQSYKQTLDRLASSPFVTHSVLIAEHEKRFDPGNTFAKLSRFRRLDQGDASLSFYRQTPEPRKKL